MRDDLIVIFHKTKLGGTPPMYGNNKSYKQFYISSPAGFREKFYNDETLREAHLRFFYWGYCLAVAYEILNFKSSSE